MVRKSNPAMLVAAVSVMLSMSSAGAQSVVGLDRSEAAIARAQPGMPLTAASSAAPEAVVRGYLQSRGRTQDVLASLKVTRSSASAGGVTQLRMEQEVDGLVVYAAYLKAAINARGELTSVIDRLVTPTLLYPSRIDAAQALAAAVRHLYPGIALNFSASGVRGNSASFDGGAFFDRAPTVTAVALPLDDGTLVRGWLVETWAGATNQLHYTAVDGEGRVVDVESRTNTDHYNVFAEDPSKGVQTIVNGPGAGSVESPSGWLAGTQTTWSINGNNANAYLDVDANNRADRGGTAVGDGDFLTPVDLSAAPSTTGNRNVAVQNLFYLNNVVHDILYRHGFTEAAGNFQVNNFGKGGAANDPVQAEAQDGSGTDNANFSTPSDGKKPRMQMYLWSGVGPTHEVVVGSTSYAAGGADFGAVLTSTGITGPLAVMSPADGCTAASASLAGKIAIIDRGTCNFDLKVKNAQNAGAIAAIVANHAAGGDAYFTMAAASAKAIKISAVMVGYTDGVSLKGSVGQSATERKKAIQPLQIDGDLDSDIVFHEYGHGLTWRMIGGMSGTLAGAVGEGASDVTAFLINGDPFVGEYAYNNPNGIRRSSYAGYPYTYNDVTGAEVHNDGEIYAAAMWRLRELFVAGSLPTDVLFDLFVDGMNYTPSTPRFEDMRDGMLTADANRGGTYQCLIWKAFAQFGIGVGAQGVPGSSSVTVTESFAVPSSCP